MWQEFLNLQGRANSKLGGTKNSSSFLKATTTTLLHTINESEKASYVAHINSYLGNDPFLKKYLPLDPATNDLFNLVRDGVLLWCVISSCDVLLLSFPRYSSTYYMVKLQTTIWFKLCSGNQIFS